MKKGTQTIGAIGGRDRFQTVRCPCVSCECDAFPTTDEDYHSGVDPFPQLIALAVYAFIQGYIGLAALHLSFSHVYPKELAWLMVSSGFLFGLLWMKRAVVDICQKRWTFICLALLLLGPGLGVWFWK